MKRNNQPTGGWWKYEEIPQGPEVRVSSRKISEWSPIMLANLPTLRASKTKTISGNPVMKRNNNEDKEWQYEEVRQGPEVKVSSRKIPATETEIETVITLPPQTARCEKCGAEWTFMQEERTCTCKTTAYYVFSAIVGLTLFFFVAYILKEISQFIIPIF